MLIRKSTEQDLNRIMEIYDIGRAFMRANGNANQWINGYPQKELILSDMEKGYSYVMENEKNEICGTFMLMVGADSTYNYIEDGNWLNDEPYCVVHRIAGDGKTKGILNAAVTFAADQCKNIRMDTHHDNIVMQNALKKNGFTYCGVIYVEDGTPRVAYQKTVS